MPHRRGLYLFLHREMCGLKLTRVGTGANEDRVTMRHVRVPLVVCPTVYMQKRKINKK